uniref:Fanconi anemia group M protein n=3 Tax=Ceratitis capitata TaxID=7213 RepID=W8CE92_CERCA
MINNSDMSTSSNTWWDMTVDDADLQKVFDTSVLSGNKSQLRTSEQHDGFDNNVGDTWLYPNNLPQREYQLSIVNNSLFKNTLVVLPTGLGKTFIAAVVMYNIYRWYPTGKIIFMAPTRPLVAQQIEACQSVMPFPDNDTVELTGRLQRSRRKELWNTKRVFFATPHVVHSDIIAYQKACEEYSVDSIFPFQKVRLIVVDEAHRARGRYAYNEVIRTIKQRNNYFRVLALSATPGRTMEDVAEVVKNLLISHIEIRCDTSVDVLPYVHKRVMKTIVVTLSEDLKKLSEEVLSIINPYIRQLVDSNVLSGSLQRISRNFLLFEQKRFRERSQYQQYPEKSSITTNFSFCISMYHALELLERHGVRVFLNYFDESDEGHCKFVLNMEPRIKRLVGRLHDELGPNPFEFPLHPMTNGRLPKISDNFYFGHPKFEQARNCLLHHFQAKPHSRAIVFCEYRESVMLMYQLLLQHPALLRPRYFIGQGNINGSLRPLTQKQQIEIMQGFRIGKYNILISTSIGEEGIDVGEVELIVCFDVSTKNPQRFIQRIGRTGRRKQGNVVVLVTEGQEHQILKDVLAQKDQTNAKILQSTAVKNSLYKCSPRLVPTDIDPKVLQVFIKPQSKGNKVDMLKYKTKNSNTSQDLKSFLKRKMIMKPSFQAENPSQHGLQTQQNLEKCLNKIDNYFKEFEDPVASNTQLLMPNTLSQISANRLRHSHSFQKLQKSLEKSCSLIPAKALITNPRDQVKSPNISNEGKMFILRSYPFIVKDTLEKMKILDILSLESHGITSEEGDIRVFYDIIEKLLGGTRSAVENFIDQMDIKSMVEKSICKHPFTNKECEGDFKNIFKVVFQKLENQLFLCDNFDYVQDELKKTEFYNMLNPDPVENALRTFSYSPSEKEVESMIYETIVLDEEGYSSNLTEFNTTTKSTIQSNYQWDDFEKNAANKSTPLHGPIVKSFQRQLLNSEKKNTTKAGDLFYKWNECISESNQRGDLDIIYLSETSADAPTVVKERSTNVKSNLPDNSCELNVASDAEQSINLKKSIRRELDFNMESFLEPFPEEIDDKICSFKLTSRKTNLNLSQEEIEFNPDLSNRKVAHDIVNMNTSSDFKSVSKEPISERSVTPPIRPQSISKSYERTPSLFEMFLQNVKNSSNLSENIKRSISFAENEVRKSSISAKNMNLNSAANYFRIGEKVVDFPSPEKTLGKLFTICNSSHVDITKKNNREANREAFMETQVPIKCLEVSTSTKTKTFHTEAQLKSSLNDCTDTKSEAGSETDCEEITEIKKSKGCARLKGKRPRRVENFLDDEAIVSGCDESDEELSGMPCSQNVKDSMIVSSDEIEVMDENEITATQMHAHYLQSIKSPKHIPRGAFKIPVFYECNDRNDIYSQTVPLESSQYVCDSFVVDEADVARHVDSRNESLSPLERAEHILKKRRRSRKKFREVAKVEHRRRVYQVPDSSDDDLNL